MKLMKTAVALALATGLAGASSAFANGGPDERELWDTLKKSAEKRADRMATTTDSMNADPNVANP